MKKIVSLFVCIISIFSFVICMNKFNVEQMNKIRSLEHQIGTAFIIPDAIALSDPEEVYSIVEKVSKDLNVNIFKDRIISDKDDNLEIRKYVLITSDTTFFDYFDIKNKKSNINKLQNKEYLSTKESDDKNQIGVIENKENIYIGHLKQFYDISMVRGTYFVELPNQITFDEFIEELVNEINTTLKTEFNIEDFIPKSQPIPELKVTDVFFEILQNIVVIATIILIIYMILNNSKKIGIYKLFGFSNMKIWLMISQIKITLVFIIMTIILALFGIYLNLDRDLIVNIIKNQLLYYILITVLSIIPLCIISSISTSVNIKNKENNKILFIFNNLLKCIFTYIIILIGVSILSDFISTSQYLSSLNNWEKGNDYGVFYPVFTGDEETKEDAMKTNAVASTKLYHELNSQGAILVNARSYEEEALSLNKNSSAIRSGEVNPNYLKEFPIYDYLGNVVNIEENEEKQILLVPNKYRSNEKDILEYFEDETLSRFEFDKDNFFGSNKNKFENQEIKIIWIKDNQDIFSFNPDVFKSDNNMIKNPIIQVITERNSFISHRWGILGGGSTDPLKIKLIENDPQTTLNELKPVLEDLKLNDNFKYLVSTNEEVLSKVKFLKDEMKIYCILFLINFVCFSILLVQNISIVFNKYKKRIVIRRLSGFNVLKSYKEYIFLFISSWTVLITLSLAFLGVKSIFIITIFMIVEFLYSLGNLIILEKRNKLNIIKGE